MTVPLPLQVLIQPIGGGTPLDITASTSDLVWSSVDPGGYAEASWNFNKELNQLDPDTYGQYSPATIKDTRDNTVIWDGLLDNPGRYAGPDGETYRMTASGAASTTKDITRPWLYIDTSLESLARGVAPFMREEIQVSVDDDPRVAGPGILITAQPGTILQGGLGIGYVNYLPLIQSGQLLGSLLTYDIESGQNLSFSAGHSFGFDLLGQYVWSHPSSPFVSTAAFFAGTHFNNCNTFALIWRLDGPTVLVPQGCWTRFGNMIVKPAIVNRHGTGVGGDPTFTYWREVIEDMVGSADRLLFADGNHCDIDDAFAMLEAAVVTQLSYADGVTDEQILSDLLLTEPRATWHFWERVGDNKYYFEWVALADAVDFDLDTDFEGLDSPGSTMELFNWVNVRVRDQSGNIRSYRFFTSCPILDAAGVIREAIVDLGDDLGSNPATIQAAADGFLTAHSKPIQSGTATVTRPVLSHFTEEMVDPWRLRAPFRVRFAGVIPGTPGSEPDGVAVFDVVKVTFDANAAAATLELDQTAASRWTPQALEPVRRR